MINTKVSKPCSLSFVPFAIQEFCWAEIWSWKRCREVQHHRTIRTESNSTIPKWLFKRYQFTATFKNFDFRSTYYSLFVFGFHRGYKFRERPCVTTWDHEISSSSDFKRCQVHNLKEDTIGNAWGLNSLYLDERIQDENIPSEKWKSSTHSPCLVV